MYLSIGNDMAVREKSIIGIFDMDNATMGADTRAFLQHAQKDGTLEISKTEIPKSFILYDKNKAEKETAVCISQLSTLSLASRVKKKLDNNF